MKHFLHQNSNWEIYGDPNSYGGALLHKFLENHGKVGGLDQDAKTAISTLKTRLGRLSRENNSGLVSRLRANMPFLEPPQPPDHIPRSNLSDSLQEQIRQIQHSTGDRRSKLLNELVQPYGNLCDLPGGVHNCGVKTVMSMIDKLQLNPTKSILLECGSGAPILGLQASLFTKQTICLDLPTVMDIVFSTIHDMKKEEAALMKTIHLVAG